ncbi:MAG: phage tail protein, partial [Humibacter sp.]
MAANVIGHATLNVVPSTKGFGSAFKGNLAPVGSTGGKQLADGVGGVLKRAALPLMVAAGVAASVAAMGAFVGSSVKAAGELEQSIGAVDSVFKGNAGQMHAWARGAAIDVGLTANEFNELGTLLGSQLKNAGTAMSDLAPRTNELIGLGADLASMFGGTSKEAVEAISSALKGERDPIERYGVSLKQATIDAKAAELGFAKVGGALSAEATTAATLALIMEQTADAHGNFARESATHEGTTQRLAASWGNITATIGQGFLPIATAAGTVLLGMMPSLQGAADWFAGLAPAVQGITEILLFGNYDGGLFAALGGITEDSAVVDILFDVREAILALFTSADPAPLADLVGGIITGGAGALTGLLASVATILPGILATVVAMAPSILSAAIGAFTALITGLVAVLPALYAAVLGMLPAIYTAILSMAVLYLDAGVQLFGGLVTALVQVFPPWVAALVELYPALAAAILGMLPSLAEAGISLFTGLLQALIELQPVLITTVLGLLPVLITTLVGMLPGLVTAGIELFLGLVMAILRALPSIITTLVGILPSLVSTLVGMVPTLIATGIELFLSLVKAVVTVVPELVGTIVTQVVPTIVGAALDAVPRLLRAGGDLIAGLVQGLWDAAGQVGAMLLDLIGGAVDGFLDFLGIHSPSRLFRSFGAHLGDALALSIGDMEGEVTAEALGLAAADYEAAEVAVGAGWAAGTAAALAELRNGDAARHATTFEDYSTSREDKQAKLQRAHLNL